MKPKFNNKSGSLTTYAFNCGYIESRTFKDTTIKLFKDGCYHVTKHSKNNRIAWECFDTLTDARKFYRTNK